jgi:UDP-N-acetylglucosamine--N-acetylmuramyl-(pentapeptide) pyrophosphoryl-undecaprenol N-acetylglucosamine transferase
MAAIRRLAVAGGGTGGHLFPGLAVAEEFRKRDEATAVLYIGVNGKMEEHVVPAAGMEFHGLDVSGLKGRGLVRQAEGAFLAWKALFECRRVLRTFAPEIVIGVGGYSSGPAALAAWSLNLPLVLQEQNTVPGLTNRLLGRLARKIFLAFGEAASFFPAGRTVVTGNPIRSDALGEPGEVGGEAKLKVLVLGGSRGARGVNTMVTAALPMLGPSGRDMVFIHQTGVDDRGWVEKAYHEAGIEAEVRTFVDGMGGKYRWADLVVSRAGAGAVSEIAAAGRPAILVPFPHAAGGHQRRNAAWLTGKGGGMLIEESDPEGSKRLAGALAELHGNRTRLRKMAAESSGAGRRDAAARIVEECTELVHAQRG